MSSKTKKELKSSPSDKSELKLIPIDRDETTPCKKCRKRCSCVIRPKEGRCTSLEEGTPWVMPLNEFED